MSIFFLTSTYNYYLYKTTNQNKTTLYIGVTNNLARRLEEHYENRGDKKLLQGNITATIWFIVKYAKVQKRRLGGKKKLRNGEGKRRKNLLKGKIPNGSF